MPTPAMLPNDERRKHEKGDAPTTASTFPAGWPGRSRRINTALAALAERAITERWHLNAEGSARYDIERERIMRENT